MLVILHGMNGGPGSSMVKDTVARANALGIDASKEKYFSKLEFKINDHRFAFIFVHCMQSNWFFFFNSHVMFFVDVVFCNCVLGWTCCAPIQRGVGQEAKIKSTIFNGISACSDLHTIAGVVRACCPNSMVVAA